MIGWAVCKNDRFTSLGGYAIPKNLSPRGCERGNIAHRTADWCLVVQTLASLPESYLLSLYPILDL
jgi:hypothetical protein